MNAIATNSEPVKLQEGYYVGGTISGPNTPMPNIEYIHHIHSITTSSDTIINSSSSPSSVSSPYSDSYSANTSGGCFTNGRYTSHTHSSSCYHKHTGDSKNGGGCYTKSKTTSHKMWRTNEDISLVGTWTKCPYCGKSVERTEEGHEGNDPSGYYASAVCFGGGKVYELNCGKDESSTYCGGSPLNTDYKYFRSCGHTAGEITQAIITY